MRLHLLPPKREFLWLVSPFIGLLFTMLLSCQDDEKSSDIQTQSAIAGTFKMNCVILTKPQIQVWVDSGWTNPADPIKKILLQFYSVNGSSANNNMQLIAYPGKSYLNLYTRGKSILAIDTTCTALNLGGDSVIFANNYIHFSDLDITDSSGQLKVFDFIRLRPIKDYPPHINFAIEVVRLTVQGEEKNAKGGTDPCPTICPEENPLQ